MRRQGFTLAEVMISLALSLFMFVAAFEFLGITRRLFSKLSGAEEEIQAATAALEKMRIDFSQAGQGLTPAMRGAATAGVEVAGQTLTLSLAEKSYALAEDVFAGQVLVPLGTASDLAAAREVCLVEGGRGEPHTISSCDSSSVILREPLQAPFSKSAGQLVLIEKISYFLDGSSGVLRRKVNGGSAQPLLESVAGCDLGYDQAGNLVKAGFSLQTNKEKKYEVSVFPKNIGLARPWR